MEQTNNWGRWGEEDERGALNLLDGETVLAGVQTCKTGRVYQLSVPVRPENMPQMPSGYRGVPHRLTLMSPSDREFFASLGTPDDVGFNEDMLVLATHTTTHIDALCHVDHKSMLYNGHPNTVMTNHAGAKKCGIDKTGAFATRGVLVDVASYRGEDVLPVEPISLDDFQATLESQRVDLRPGDAVLVRTGWMEHCITTGAPMTLEQPGIGLDVAQWLSARDVVAVGADNTSVEVTPFDNGRFMACHVELLYRHGIYMMEHVWVAELAADRCFDFLFCVAPLLVPGATGSPVNPVAIG